MLKLTDVSVSYGGYQALEHINLSVKQGEFVVLLGANGAGKSTIFRTISGLSKPSSGSIEFNNQSISGLSADRLVSLGIVQCAEGRKLFPQMTVYENLILGGFVHRRDKGKRKKSLHEVFELFPILNDKKDDPAGSLSGGQQQMLAIGRALMASPKVILLDEPSIGLAPLIVEQVFSVIQQINKNGTTVLLAEQNANAALKIADRGYVIETGKIVLEGSSKDLFENDEVRKAYIGA
ncbi:MULTISPECIES: ABC transporter ATP-binding protein [Bacillaceae]|uniref:ABC transporter ATP-binding protein n=1 Tax=Bacillaceae TaxID=186817 RepID=UPI000BFC68D1|nr:MULTISPECIES: ABC transporter ATP-binding protein [Bacillaceae]PGT91585.1 branched-chain amino acid ABC transporter ATP-binding protein [Bacillus sp. AFS040349]UGB28997.1 ABC transporter ATP-binding protein [Metabacillus sp. B2-18]